MARSATTTPADAAVANGSIALAFLRRYGII